MAPNSSKDGESFSLVICARCKENVSAFRYFMTFAFRWRLRFLLNKFYLLQWTNIFHPGIFRGPVTPWSSMRALSNKIIAIALPGFNDLGRSVTPIFLLMNHFLYRFSTFSEKMKKIYRLEAWFFCKMHHRIPLFLALRLSVRQFQMPLEGLSFVKTLATFGIIYARPTSTKYN